MAEDEVEHVEGGAVTPTLEVLRMLTVALDATLHLCIEADSTHMSFVDDAA